jgi:hypothetical protein
MRRDHVAIGGAAGLLAAATVYEASVAFGWIALGNEPGDGPPLDTPVAIAAVATYVVAIAAAALLASRALAVLAAAGAALVVARFYTFDPYYLPTHRRMSDQGLFPTTWIAAVCIGAAIAVAVTIYQPRRGRAFTTAILIACVFTFLFAGAGH